jgi:CelD/BcsL family acetyltransferase involved in cellulose biosynthesis
VVTIHAALEHAFRVGDTRVDLGAGGQWYKYNFSHTAESIQWSLLVARGWRSLLARAQLAPLRARIVLAQQMSPRAKHAIRRAATWCSAVRRI